MVERTNMEFDLKNLMVLTGVKCPYCSRTIKYTNKICLFMGRRTDAYIIHKKTVPIYACCRRCAKTHRIDFFKRRGEKLPRHRSYG